MHSNNNNNNEYLKHLTHTGPKHLHIYMALNVWGGGGEAWTISNLSSWHTPNKTIYSYNNKL